LEVVPVLLMVVLSGLYKRNLMYSRRYRGGTGTIL